MKGYLFPIIGSVIMILLFSPSKTFGQDVIKASGGTNLSIDSVATQGFTPIDGPTIRETASGQLDGGGTITLSLPSGFVWNDALTADDITITIEPTGAANTKLEVSFTSITQTEATFTIDTQSSTNGNGQGPGRLEIQGLELRPNTTNVPTTGQISNTGSTGPDTNYGNLSTAVGAISNVQVETKADGTGQIVQKSDNLLAGNSITVYAVARDVGENFIRNIALNDEADWILTGGSGTIPQTALTPSTDLKSAIFSPTTTGTTTIQANYSGVNSVPSELITVDPRPATAMTIETQPTDTVTAGQTFPQQPVLYLWDQFGNKVTTDNTTEVTLGLNSGNADFSPQTIQASGGEIIYTGLSSTIADTISLKFESSELSTVTSDEIVVLPATVSDLSFVQQPTNTGSNNKTIEPFPSIQLLDEFGNKVLAADTTVNIIDKSFINTNQSTLTGQTDATGIATFNDIVISGTAGTDVQLTAQLQGGSPLVEKDSDVFSIIGQNALAGYEIKTSADTDIGQQQAGTTFDITITALNGNGNTFTFNSDSTLTITADNTIDGDRFDVIIQQDNSSVTTPITLTSTGSTKIYADASEDISGESNSFNVLPSNTISLSQSTVTANPTSITANGSSTSQITVQLKDEFGNNLDSGGETVELTTTAGTFSNGDTTITANDEGDGTYTSELTSSTTAGETANITAALNGDSNTINDNATVNFEAGKITAFDITLPNPSEQTAGQQFNIDVEAIDSQGNKVNSFNDSATLSTNATFDSGTNTTINFSNGTASPSVTINEADSAVTLTVTADNLYNVSQTSNSFIVLPASPDASTSTVTAVPDVIQNDNNSQSVVTVILRDQFNNRLYQSNTVSLSLEQLEENNTTTGGVAPNATLSNNSNIPYDPSKGVYHDTLISSNTVELVEITATYGTGSTPINQTASVDIVIPNTWTANAGGPSGNRTDWTNPENWSQGTVPTSEDFVIIPDIADLPILDLNIEMGSFEIQSGVSLTLFGGNSITVSGNTIVNGNLDIEDNTELDIGGNFEGTGSFTAGESTTINIGGDISLGSFLARTPGSQINLNGDSPQTITTDNFLAQKLNILNDVTVTSGNLIDTSELTITDGNTLEIAQDAGVTVDNIKSLTGEGQFILNNNTLVVSGDLSLLNIDTSEGTVVFGIRQGEDFSNYPNLQRQQISNLSQMQNAVINNINGVRTTEDIIVDGDSLVFENGELIISSGKSLIAPNQIYNNGSVTFRRTIRNKGWVMLGSPVNASLSNLTDPLTTQGVANSDYPNNQPNLLYYLENAQCTDQDGNSTPCTDNQRWRKPADINNNIHLSNVDSTGRGYFFYIFGNVDGDSRYNDTLPKTLNVSGEEHQNQSSTFDFTTISYTASADTVESMVGWNLLSNPWGATLDWDEANWNKTNVDNVIYVWDPSTNSYKTWNGIDGSLSDGLIKPFQAFWVKANGSNPTLTVDKSAKTTGGTYYGKSKKEPASIGFKLEADTLETETHLTLTPDGSNAKDRYDGYRLLPFETDTYLELYTTFDDGTELSINNLARSFGKEISIPLHVGGFKNGQTINGEYTLSWPTFGDVPEEWTMILEDRENGEKIDLRKNTFYSFNLSQSKAKTPIQNTVENFTLVRNQPAESKAKSQSKSSADESRFVIRISPGADGSDVPNEYSLGKNYPNPFSSQTTIEYNTPVESNVQIHIYDILGRKVKTILDERRPADYHTIDWTPTQLASGVYIVVMQAEDKQFSKKITYIK